MQRTRRTAAGEEVEESQPLYTAGESVTWDTVGDRVDVPHKTENRAALWPSGSTPMWCVCRENESAN